MGLKLTAGVARATYDPGKCLQTIYDALVARTLLFPLCTAKSSAHGVSTCLQSVLLCKHLLAGSCGYLALSQRLLLRLKAARLHQQGSFLGNKSDSVAILAAIYFAQMNTQAKQTCQAPS